VIIPSGLAASQRSTWPLVSTLPPLAPFPSVPKVARGHLAVTCTGWNLGTVAEDGQEVVSELATNAVNASVRPDGNPRYIGGWRMPTVTLRLSSDGIRLLVEVNDEVPGRRPALADAGTDAESGRGLTIVDALSADWGWHPVPGGKCVWAVLFPS
jgi:anti-sigma regulatory factor (Ser/Thr protein kinase)